MTAAARLEQLVGPLIAGAIIAAVREELAAESAALSLASPSAARWLTLEAAAERLDCTPDAIRMRVKRGRLEARRHGRRVYVSAASVDTLGGGA